MRIPITTKNHPIIFFDNEGFGAGVSEFFVKIVIKKPMIGVNATENKRERLNPICLCVPLNLAML